MAGFVSQGAKRVRQTAFAAAAIAFMGAPALAGDFTQDECKGIKVTATQVVKTIGKDNLSMEFRQSFLNWMGRDLRCEGPKDIVIRNENDSATYGTIRVMLLSGSHPLSLEKAGLRVIVRPIEKVSSLSAPQKRSDAGLVPAIN